MGTLGEAYVAVKADLRPFTRDLNKELKDVVDKFEKRLSDSLGVSFKGADAKGLGASIGDSFGDGFSDSFGKKMGDKNKPPWINIPAAFAAALDDGISALPTEVKAAIVGGIILAAPLVSAALAGAVGAGLGLGLAGIGTFIAFQFQEVKDRGVDLADFLRDMFVEAARPFAQEVFDALGRIQVEFDRLSPRFARIFAAAAKFVDPIVDGLIDMVDFISDSIDNFDDDLGPFVEELSKGFGTLGAAIGEALEILVGTGEVGAQGLRDLITLTADLLVGSAQLIAVMAELYGFVRDIAEALPWLTSAFGLFIAQSNNAAETGTTYATTNLDLIHIIDGVVVATEKEVKALKEAERQMDANRDAAFALVDSHIAFEESLDRLDEALKRNGKTLAFETDEGRDNLERLGAAIRAAQTDAENRYKSGELTSAQAQQFYDAEIQKIIAVAKAHGVTEDAIRRVYGAAISLANLPAGAPQWMVDLAAAAKRTAELIERSLRAAQKLRQTGQGTPWGGGIPEFADGAIVDTPTLAMIGEAGREVVIPLTNPSRAAQLAQQSGLTQLLGGGSTMVQVFIGNEQLDARMVRIVEKNNGRQAQNLAYGARS